VVEIGDIHGSANGVGVVGREDNLASWVAGLNSSKNRRSVVGSIVVSRNIADSISWDLEVTKTGLRSDARNECHSRGGIKGK